MIHATTDGVVLDLRVQPGAARTAVAGRYGDAIKVKVSAPTADGRANAAVLALVAQELGVRPHQVELVSGASSRTKRVLVTGVALTEVEAWLRTRVAD